MVVNPWVVGQSIDLPQLTLIIVIGLVVITILIWLIMDLRKRRESAGARRRPSATAARSQPARSVGLTELDPYFSTAMRTVAERNNLDSITVATTDGLAVISTRPDPYEEAALYGAIPPAGTPDNGRGVRRFSMNFRGIPLVGIVRSEQEPTPNWMANVEDDIKIILSLWI
jgi:hypothetical protein